MLTRAALFLSELALVMALLVAFSAAALAQTRTLRVCADPNNLPFSNQKAEGFENRLAALISAKIGARVEYTWWAQRESLVENALDKGRCDVLMGAPAGMDSIEGTAPYYRSTYVIVSRADKGLRIESLYDERLASMRIGVHVVGDDYAPPAHLLGARGLAANLKGFSLFGAYGEPDPPARLLDALVNGQVDVAIVWGPLAGYYARNHSVRLTMTPVTPARFGAAPFAYDFVIGVRKGETGLRDELDRALAAECGAVSSLLSEYGIPTLATEKGGTGCASTILHSAVSR